MSISPFSSSFIRSSPVSFGRPPLALAFALAAALSWLGGPAARRAGAGRSLRPEHAPKAAVYPRRGKWAAHQRPPRYVRRRIRGAHRRERHHRKPPAQNCRSSRHTCSRHDLSAFGHWAHLGPVTTSARCRYCTCPGLVELRHQPQLVSPVQKLVADLHSGPGPGLRASPSLLRHLFDRLLRCLH